MKLFLILCRDHPGEVARRQARCIFIAGTSVLHRNPYAGFLVKTGFKIKGMHESMKLEGVEKDTIVPEMVVNFMR